MDRRTHTHRQVVVVVEKKEGAVPVAPAKARPPQHPDLVAPGRLPLQRRGSRRQALRREPADLGCSMVFRWREKR